MVADDYNFLMEIYQGLQQDLSKLDAQIESNSLKIKEADIYLKDFSEPEDYKIFSPRNKEVVYREEINNFLKKKADYEEKNKQLIQERNAIFDRIQRLKKVINRKNENLSVLKIQEEDRKRIARELHDTSLQNLTYLVHKVELVNMYIDTDPTQAKLELSVFNKHLKEIIEEIRSTIFDLRPMVFDDLGMKASLERMLEEIKKEENLEIKADIENVSCGTNMILLSIYRIIQEAITNAVKHADAKQVIFRFKQVGENCVIDIIDDGKGFQEGEINKEKHFGISLMKERVQLLNGSISIHSEEEKGTEIHVEIPLNINLYNESDMGGEVK